MIRSHLTIRSASAVDLPEKAPRKLRSYPEIKSAVAMAVDLPAEAPQKLRPSWQRVKPAGEFQANTTATLWHAGKTPWLASELAVESAVAISLQPLNWD
jgi:hypothetical protein